jgi:hypothetical protein
MRNWLNDLMSGLHSRRVTPGALVIAPRGRPALRPLHAAVAPSAVSAGLAPLSTEGGVPMAAQPAVASRSELAVPFVEWLQTSGTRETPLGPREGRALGRLDELLAANKTPAELLPRAPAVVPQLLNLLRDDNLPLPAVAERVGKDIVLAAEVLRLAGSAHYRGRSREAVTTLPQAIGALGSDGVQRAIARVVLKPMFDNQPGVLAGRAAPRLWEHGDLKAALCAGLAAQKGVDPFEAYLAGLMHNTGWSMAWRALDRLEGGPSAPFSLSFVRLLTLRTERLFGKVAAAWQITPALAALGADVFEGGLDAARSPLARVLAAADRDATATVIGVMGQEAVVEHKMQA